MMKLRVSIFKKYDMLEITNLGTSKRYRNFLIQNGTSLDKVSNRNENRPWLSNGAKWRSHCSTNKSYSFPKISRRQKIQML